MSEWREVSLGDAPIEILDGDRGKNYPKKHDFSDSGYCLFLNTKNVTSSGFNFNELNFITKEKDENLRKGKLKRNDVVLTTRGTVGNVAFYGDNIKFENIRINSGMVIIRPLDIDPVFNLQLFKFLTLDLSEYTSGSAQPQLPIRDLKQILVSIPPLPEQKAIAEVLSARDDKIDLLHRQNKTLEQMAETLFRQWFVEEAGEDWEEGVLGDLVEVKYGKDHKKLNDGKIPVYGSGGIMRHAEMSLYDDESVLIPRIGTLNNVVYINEPFWTVDTMFYTIMRKPNTAKFIYQFIKKIDLASMNVGSAVPSMTTQVLNSMPLLIPFDKEFEYFENAVTPFYTKSKSNKTQIRTLETLRDTLLPKLMSGEVRIASHG